MSIRFIEKFEPEEYEKIEDVDEHNMVDITEVMTIGSFVY